MHINRKESSISSKTIQDEYYCTMKELRNKLKDPKFVLSHRSFFVNCMYIQDFRQRQVKLSNGDIIPVSQTYREEAVKRWVKWLKLTNISNFRRNDSD